MRSLASTLGVAIALVTGASAHKCWFIGRHTTSEHVDKAIDACNNEFGCVWTNGQCEDMPAKYSRHGRGVCTDNKLPVSFNEPSMTTEKCARKCYKLARKCTFFAVSRTSCTIYSGSKCDSLKVIGRGFQTYKRTDCKACDTADAVCDATCPEQYCVTTKPKGCSECPKATCEMPQKRCLEGKAYIDAPMVDRSAPAKNAQECRDQCKKNKECWFWDWDTRHCRLRSSQGSGAKSGVRATAGSKNCALPGEPITAAGASLRGAIMETPTEVPTAVPTGVPTETEPVHEWKSAGFMKRCQHMMTISSRLNLFSDKDKCMELAAANPGCDGKFFEMRWDRSTCRCNRKGRTCRQQFSAGSFLFEIMPLK